MTGRLGFPEDSQDPMPDEVWPPPFPDEVVLACDLEGIIQDFVIKIPFAYVSELTMLPSM